MIKHPRKQHRESLPGQERKKTKPKSQGKPTKTFLLLGSRSIDPEILAMWPQPEAFWRKAPGILHPQPKERDAGGSCQSLASEQPKHEALARSLKKVPEVHLQSSEQLLLIIHPNQGGTRGKARSKPKVSPLRFQPGPLRWTSSVICQNPEMEEDLQ